MNLSRLPELFSLREIRNAVLGLFVVFGGIGLAGLTVYAHQTGNSRLAGIAAAVSLVFVLLILIFIVPPLAKNAGREAAQMNLPFEFTAGGAFLLVLIVIVGFSAWNTGNNLLFLVLSFLIGSMAVGFLAGMFCLQKLDVKMRFPETIFAGQETPILVSIHNRKRVLPSYSVVAEVRGKEREKSVAADDLKGILPAIIAERLTRPPIVSRTLNYFIHLPRNKTAEYKNSHIFQYRGRFLIKDFELSTRFPFGFFRHRRRLPARETELIVFPRLEPLDEELNSIQIEAGKLTAGQRGTGQDLLAMRDYQPNDDLRRVDWKATARARHLIVREFFAEDDKKITIFFDTRIPRENDKNLTLRKKIEAEQSGQSMIESERFERGVTRAASLLAFYNDERCEFRLITGAKKGEFGIGNAHFFESLRRLAVVEPEFMEMVDAADIAAGMELLLAESENSRNILLSTIDEAALPEEIAREFEFIQL